MERNELDNLVQQFVVTTDAAQKEKLGHQIWDEALNSGIYPASINDLYMARGKNKCSGFTVPAMNLRALTYDLASAIFRSAKKINAGAFIFEIARSEMGYTDQKPLEYTTVCLAAAIREGFKGPVFIQGDHFQINAKKFKEDAKKEIEGLKKLIKESIEGGFLNIDIDSSTLVDLGNKDLAEEQRLNYEMCAEMTKYIRSLEPKGITISVGGEIGEVGTKNSTPEELGAFMKGYLAALPKGMTGISKVSVQTGTSHGGVVLPDGTIAKVKLDFDTLKTLSEVARKEYQMSGAVQHGASTLPEDAFHKFVAVETAEVHLATQFQNMIFESKNLPHELKEKMYSWVKENLKAEWKEGATEEQFIYSARKKVLGPFKKDLMSLSQAIRDKIGKELEEKFDFLFGQLNIKNTKDLVDKFIKPVKINKVIKSLDSKAEHFEGDD
ncbi:MAG: class II fructose-bisphosphate aldolase [Candidatus Omnitrophica bacterium]|nr:class II fructose-bisphosphate aldolase [Candidatus Omnitrophota bacterium]MDD5351813.1 class II fructose-bisphosphate aldolase [Candidatus Omnitrophota bacterium]MDD5550639.1 class II fructose-bisphosphate aldolase [Candidatus Omnitrophota bacterium]